MLFTSSIRLSKEIAKCPYLTLEELGFRVYNCPDKLNWNIYGYDLVHNDLFDSSKRETKLF